MSPRSVLITGTSTGIGRATALHLDSRGFRVFAGVRRAEHGEALRAEASPRLVPVLLDVTDEAQVAAAARDVGEALAGAGLDGLVNNAGVTAGGPVEFLDMEELRRSLEVNLYGPVRVTRAFMPLVRRATGRIVHVTSIGGRLSVPFAAPYSAAKFAMEAVADAQRFELRPWGMHVSVVEPGVIATPILEKSLSQASTLRDALPEAARALYAEGIRAVEEGFRKASARATPPLEVARAIEHALTAARPRTRYVVGVDAKVQGLLRWLLPDRAFDAVMARALGLKSPH